MARRNEVLPQGSRFGERYAVVRVIGVGAMGTVYEVSGPSGARLALKALVSPDADKRGADTAERRARFLREAELCASIESPHVVPVIDHGIDAASDAPYLVMPLLGGEDLAAVLDRVGALDPDVAVALIAQACVGLDAAHARGIVHRDVKPSNLFLEASGDHVVVRVTDFGLAKAAAETGSVSPAARGGLTGTGRFMGTPQYVSPEQAVSAKHVDARSDVFSLAMSLYHALSGAPAFAYAKSFMGLVLELTGREAPPVQDAAPWIPPALARVVHAALLRDRVARCPSVGELALALDMAVGIDRSRRPVGRRDLVGMDGSRRQAAPRAAPVSSWSDVLRA